MELNEAVSAVVTGGASGLGAGTARALAAKGCRVGILDVNADSGEAVAKEIGGTFARCDVTDEASVDAALAAVRSAHGQERVLVNCAGAWAPALLKGIEGRNVELPVRWVRGTNVALRRAPLDRFAPALMARSTLREWGADSGSGCWLAIR